MTYLLNGKFDMFKSASAFWEWLTSASAKTYVIIICVLIALLIAAVIFAAVKKARIQKNDVNVLMLLGDDDRSVDAEIFKRNYAMVLVSKNDNTRTAKDIEVEQPELLAADAEEFEAAENELVSDVTTADDDEFIIEDTVSDEEVEDVVEETQDNAPQASEEIEEIIEVSEPITETLVVDEEQEEIPFNELADDAVEEEIEEIAEEEIDEISESDEVIAEVDDEPIEEAAEDVIEIEEEPIEEIDEIEDAEDAEVEEVEDTVMEVAEIDSDTVDEEAQSEDIELSVTPMPVINNSEDEVEVESFENELVEIDEAIAEPTADEPLNTIYDIDASEDYARDCIEVVDYIRIPGKVASETSLTEDEPQESAETETAEEKLDEPVDVREELFMIEVEPDVVSEVEEDVEEIAEPVTELAVEEVTEELSPVDTKEVAEEVTSEAASDVIDYTQERAVVIDDNDGSDEEDKDTSAYTIVKEEEAVPEAIEAAQNGEIIVDANGDGIAAEVLVDKNILKARYKTVDLETRLRRADESTKVFYSELKNFLLSYDGVKSRVSKKFDTFTIGRFIVAKMAIRGNVINLYLALASESIDDKYFAEDVGDSDTYGKTPTLHKVKSKRGCKYGIELIRDIMSELQIPNNESYVPTDFAAAYPPENIDEKKDAIRHLFKESVGIEDAGILSDEEALELIEIVKNKQYTINKFMPINKYVVFVDDLDALYTSGDTVTISDLIEKEALPNEENIFLEIRAKGTITKPLTVEAHSFDPAAIKMIILTDGKVIQYK